MKKYLVQFLKFAIPLAIIVWLLSSNDPAQLEELWSRPKHWGLLSGAFCMAFAAVCLTFLRWFLLVRTLDIPFTLADAFRLSFLGYLFNFVSAGSVGGDLFKAIFIAREQPGRRTEAVATVVVDRIMGLYALLLVSCAAVLLGNVPNPTPGYRAVANLTFVCTAIGGASLLFILVPAFTGDRLTNWLATWPRVGGGCKRLISSVRVYRNKRGVMALIFVMSMGVHCFLAVSIFLMSRGLFGGGPSLGEHLIIVPLAMVAGALPLTPSGLGSMEFAMEELYKHVPAAGTLPVSGILIALAFRLVTILIAVIGLVYYWTYRREVRSIEAEVAAKTAVSAAE